MGQGILIDATLSNLLQHSFGFPNTFSVWREECQSTFHSLQFQAQKNCWIFYFMNVNWKTLWKMFCFSIFFFDFHSSSAFMPNTFFVLLLDWCDLSRPCANNNIRMEQLLINCFVFPIQVAILRRFFIVVFWYRRKLIWPLDVSFIFELHLSLNSVCPN